MDSNPPPPENHLGGRAGLYPITNGGATRHQGAEFSGRLDTGALRRSRHNFYLRAAYTLSAEASGRDAVRRSSASTASRSPSGTAFSRRTRSHAPRPW